MISGPGPSALTINANGNLHVFQLLLPNQVTVAGLTLTGATAGAIHNTAITTLSDDNIIGNNNTSSRGRVGGVFTAGTMTIQNSAVNDNAGIETASSISSNWPQLPSRA